MLYIYLKSIALIKLCIKKNRTLTTILCLSKIWHLFLNEQISNRKSFETVWTLLIKQIKLYQPDKECSKQKSILINISPI